MRHGKILGITLLTLTIGAAHADTTGSGGGFNGSGTLTIQSTGKGDGSYLVTAITGDYVDSLIPVNGFHGNQNLVFPGQTPTLDPSGFSFTATEYDTDFDVNLFSAGPNSYKAYIVDYLDTDQNPQTIDVQFNLGMPATSSFRSLAATLPTDDSFTIPFSFEQANAVTPEPATVALLGTGLAGLAGVLRRRQRNGKR